MKRLELLRPGVTALAFCLALTGHSQGQQAPSQPTSSPPVRAQAARPYDAIASCAEMWGLKSTPEASITVLRDESKVTTDRVTVEYGEFRRSGSLFQSSSGIRRCAVNSEGKVGAHRSLCAARSGESDHPRGAQSLRTILVDYPWLSDKLTQRDSAGRLIPGIEVFADLNGDGVPEFSSARLSSCGKHGCRFALYSIDATKKSLTPILENLDDLGGISRTRTIKNGWSVLTQTFCVGPRCVCEVLEFDSTDQNYVPVERHLITR